MWNQLLSSGVTVAGVTMVGVLSSAASWFSAPGTMRDLSVWAKSGKTNRKRKGKKKCIFILIL
jgi:hypothetical protein